MKFLIPILTLITFTQLTSQNIFLLFEGFPGASENCQLAFESAELEWVTEQLFSGEDYNRVVSWAPGGELKEFGLQLDRMMNFIERSSENNSFSLNAPPSIDEATINELDLLNKLQYNIQGIWGLHRDKIGAPNIDFVVPNELNNSCEQIQESILELNKTASGINAAYASFYSSAKPEISRFQELFNSLNKIKNPMVNNQCLDELSNVATILLELNGILNFQYKNMVETRMAFNNALCK